MGFVCLSLIKNINLNMPHGLRRRFAAVSLLGFRVRILPEIWIFFSCECCVLSGRGLCVGLITHPGKSYLLCYVQCVCDREAP